MNIRKFLYPIAAVFFTVTACDDGYHNIKPSIAEPAELYITSADASEEIELLEPKSKNISVQICANSISDQNLEITIKADPSLVDAYNKAHNTDYTFLSAEAYEIPEEPILLPRYNTTSSILHVALKSEALEDENYHILPLTIDKVSGSENVNFSEEGRQIYIVFKKKVIPGAIRLPKKDWRILYYDKAKNEKNKGIDTGYAEHLIDDSWSTYWNYDPNAPETDPHKYAPFSFVIDLGKTQTIRGAVFTARRYDITDFNSNPRVMIARARIEVAATLTKDDGSNAEDWIYSEDFDTDVLKNVNESTVYLEKACIGRYVRFTYVNGYTSSGNPTYKGGSLAELDILGNEEILDFE